MSTRLTSDDLPMVDSQSLKLVFSTANLHDQITQYLSMTLKEKGYESATPSVLSFLSALECGVNYGSEIARTLGVSRQMVAKTVKEPCRVGYLEQVDGIGKQKQILFTDLGERLVSDARQVLADLDADLCQRIGGEILQETVSNLDKIQTLIQAKIST